MAVETLYDILRAHTHALRGQLSEEESHQIRHVIDEHDPKIAEAKRVAEQTMSDTEKATLADLLAKAERVNAAQQAQATPAPAPAPNPGAQQFFASGAPAQPASAGPDPNDPNFVQPAQRVPNQVIEG